MKPTLPKGTRDFGPEAALKRQYIFRVIRSVFEKYGYRPIETPALESLSTLTGKYGEEGDRLLFKVLNNGDFLDGADEAALARKDSNALAFSIAKRGLRYDLTVPFARFVVMNQNDITFPFKRYQIQPVWRADRPQKGRYQEFYQCDADVVGSSSLLYEAELVQIYDEVFAALGLKTTIKVNNRKILNGIAEIAGIPDRLTEMTVAIDKLDKVGLDGVRQEMLERGISDTSVAKIESVLEAKDLSTLSDILKDSKMGQEGIEELRKVFAYLKGYHLSNALEFDITLARGLNYYTGCILEVKANDVQMGSIGGGGRYDDLTGVFGLKDVPGVGISFGAERIYDALEELHLFPAEVENTLKVIFMAFDEPTLQFAFQCLSKVRAAGIPAEIYPDPGKIKKQMKYANDRNIPFVAIIGESEMQEERITTKNMVTGEQTSLSLEDLIIQLQETGQNAKIQ